MKNFILIISTFILFYSCTDNSIDVSGDLKNREGLRSVQGIVQVNHNDWTPGEKDLDIVSFYEDERIKADNSFDVDVPESGTTPHLVFVENRNDDFVMAGYVNESDNEIVINELTTAKVLVYSNVIFIGTSAEEKNYIFNQIELSPSFASLQLKAAEVIKTDLDNVFNTEKYPELHNLASKVALEVYSQFQSRVLAANGIGNSAPGIAKCATNEGYVTFSNPNLVFLCGQSKNLYDGKYEHVFTVGRRSSILKWYWIGVSPSEKTDTKFSDENTCYSIKLTKGFDKNNLSFTKLFNWNTSYGRASILNMIVALEEVISLAGGGDYVIAAEAVQTVITSNKDEITLEYENMKNALNKGQKIEAFKSMMAICGKILPDLVKEGAISYAQSKIVDKMVDFVKKVTKTIPIIGQLIDAKQVAFETIPFITDVIFGDNYYDYKVQRDRGVIIDAQLKKANEPLTPYIIVRPGDDGGSGKLYVFSEGYENESFKYIVTERTGFFGLYDIEWSTKNYDSEYLNNNEKYSITIWQSQLHYIDAYSIDKNGKKSKTASLNYSY